LFAFSTSILWSTYFRDGQRAPIKRLLLFEVSSEPGQFVLNQERKDARIDRILLIQKSFPSWFKTTALPCILYFQNNTLTLPFLVQRPPQV
ncbi:hypothetical protein, partial [Sphingobacterium sp.]|uniref:hypothetical protein n=1 Tax=Sphingobacterium sp. TaxID=341027 RepID=UPI00289C0FE1